MEVGVPGNSKDIPPIYRTIKETTKFLMIIGGSGDI